MKTALRCVIVLSGYLADIIFRPQLWCTWFESNDFSEYIEGSWFIIATLSEIAHCMRCICRSQWPRCLRRRSAAARLLRLWVRISLGGWVSVCWVLRVLRYRPLRRADHSSRGVVPSVARRCVWSRNLVNEKALTQWGLSRQKQTKCDVSDTLQCVWEFLHARLFDILLADYWGRLGLNRDHTDVWVVGILT